MSRIGSVGVLALLWSCFLVLPTMGQPGTTELVSVSSEGVPANGPCVGQPAITPDGRFVAFPSRAMNLVPGQISGVQDVYVRDRVAGTTERVDVASDGSVADRSADYYVAISHDGRFVAFASDAATLVPGDNNQREDVFVHDRLLGTTERVSVTSTGEQGQWDSTIWPGCMRSDGRYVVFTSADLTPDHNRGAFVRDRVRGTTEYVSFGTQNEPLDGVWASISADGRFVAFGSQGVYVRDRLLDSTDLASVGSDGSPWPSAYDPSISPDGRCVAFCTNGGIVVRDRLAQTTDAWPLKLVSGRAWTIPSISEGGRYVTTGAPIAYQDTTYPYPSGFPTVVGQVMVIERTTGLVRPASVSNEGAVSNRDSGFYLSTHRMEYQTPITPDGRFVAFISMATNLVPGIVDGNIQVYVHEMDRSVCPVEGVVDFGPLCPGVAPPDTLMPSIWSGDTFLGYCVMRPGADGAYNAGLPAGDLRLSAKPSHWLRRSPYATILPSQTNHVDFELINGDADLNNSVGLPDLSVVLGHFGWTIWQAGSDADVDLSGVIGIRDLSIVLLNFGSVGDP